MLRSPLSERIGPLVRERVPTSYVTRRFANSLFSNGGITSQVGVLEQYDDRAVVDQLRLEQLQALWQHLEAVVDDGVARNLSRPPNGLRRDLAFSAEASGCAPPDSSGQRLHAGLIQFNTKKWYWATAEVNGDELVVDRGLGCRVPFRMRQNVRDAPPSSRYFTCCDPGHIDQDRRR